MFNQFVDPEKTNQHLINFAFFTRRWPIERLSTLTGLHTAA